MINDRWKDLGAWWRKEEQEKEQNLGVYTIGSLPHGFYKSYLMIKMKIIILSVTQNSDIYFFPRFTETRLTYSIVQL